jgi:hypothetical protein
MCNNILATIAAGWAWAAIVTAVAGVVILISDPGKLFALPLVFLVMLAIGGFRAHKEEG